MSGILDVILGQLGHSEVGQMADKIGANHEQTKGAIEVALPTMIEGLGRKNGGNMSIDDLSRELGVGESSQPTDVDPGNVRIPTEQADRNQGGLNDILGGFFGVHKDRVNDSIGQKSGLSNLQVGAIIAMLGPIVLNALSKRAKASGNKDVSDVVQKEREVMHNKSGVSSILGSMFDQDGDGDFDTSDVIKFGINKMVGKK